ERMRSGDKAVLMIQQHTYWIEALCQRALWLDHGRPVMIGKATDVVRAYLDDQDKRLAGSARRDLASQPVQAAAPAAVEAVERAGEDGTVRDDFGVGERLTVRIHYHADQRIEYPLFNIRIFHRGQGVLEASMLIDGPEVESIEGRGLVECRLDRLPLTPTTY